jgi:transcriptional regulator with XRE-family HTH domain
MTEPEDAAGPRRKTLGELIRRERERRRVSQKKAGPQFFGIDQSVLSRWEAGEAFPSDEKEAVVAEFLGISTDEVRALKYGVTASLTTAELHARIDALEARAAQSEATLDRILSTLSALDSTVRGLTRLRGLNGGDGGGGFVQEYASDAPRDGSAN